MTANAPPPKCPRGMSPVWNTEAERWECARDPSDLDDSREQRKMLAFAWALFFLIVSGTIAAIRCAFVPDAVLTEAPAEPQ